MSGSGSAETTLARLLGRLLTAAEASLAAGDVESARATAEEVRAVDPDNERAALILRRVAGRRLSPFGERALMTLLFSDLVGSTMLSEQVEPEQLRDLFSFYREAAKDAVERYNGYVMQYSGDGILAGFGYPEPHEDDARRAVLAGLDLVVALGDARSELERRVGVAAEVRVGIHTGRVVVTDLSDDRSVPERDSIVGVVPNLAARIQQAAEPGMVVISDVTQQLVDADFYVHSLGEQVLKGISRPVEVYAVERPRYAGARFEAERYRKAGLVGRDEPRDRLFSAWDEAREGTRTAQEPAFLVVGEAGIGKSRLVAEVVDRVESSGGRVLGAGCLPYYTNVSLWPIARLLERTLDLVGNDHDRVARLVEHLDSLALDPAPSVPFLASLLGVADADGYPTPELDPRAVLEETLAVVVEWLIALSARTPHLFVVEDLHWADPSTLELLGRVVRARPPALLTLLTTREGSAVGWRDEVRTVELGRLDLPAANRLVDNLAFGRELQAEKRDSIVRQAEGIPLFIEELTRSCLDNHGEEPLPLRLQELFTWRLKAPAVDLRVAQVAATVGPTFDVETLAAVVGDGDTVGAQLVVLTEEGVIEPGDPAAQTYRFRHALMRDAAYETQVLDVRRHTHARVAEVLSQRGAEPALVAEHLDRAGEPAKAATLYLVAAQAEQRHGAHTEATRLLSQALHLLGTLPESEERDVGELTATMLRALSVSSMQGYAAPEVQADHRRAELLATRLGTRPEVLPSLIAIWSYWLVHGDLGTARGLIDRLSAMVRDPAFSWFEPEVEACAGWQELYAGHLESARVLIERGLAGFAARPADQTVSPFWPLPNDPVAVSQTAMGCISALCGDLSEAERWEGEAVRRSEAIGFPQGPFSLAFVKTFAAWVRRFAGDQEAAWRLGSEVVAIGREHGYTFWATIGSAYAATDPPGGEAHRAFLEQVIATLRLMGQESFAAAHLGYLAQLHAEAGDPDRAVQLVDEAIESVHKTGEYLHLPELLRQRARYSLGRGRPDSLDAVADLMEAEVVAAQQGAAVARLRAAVDLAALPPSSRPQGWKAVLTEARTAVPPAFSSADTAAADDLLAGSRG
ncbi:AAA ATPase domain-containing protein [Pedococcus cremeus]|uniref:AAA ATPase domain-containing protein n=1 Tax=Pedococcus cremeus TaxID=587636 RepID=A0A1H9V247_9MICO|nr:adenylate/guanylate cyclase domain-containing protein [Pedococcus cremeus]SES15890.1 AAA ATPase domain-containing protein [Pedococcus cremeus]